MIWIRVLRTRLRARIGPFVEIQSGVVIGARCKIQSHVFIPEGVTLEDGVFVGHGVMFTNDRWPRAVNEDGELNGAGEWTLIPTLVKRRAVVGNGATLMPVIVGDARIGYFRRMPRAVLRS